MLLLEALLDTFMLSRSSVLVGSMMSNFPRLALQLRVQAPIGDRKRYLALDGREWCTRTSCRMNYTECAALLIPTAPPLYCHCVCTFEVSHLRWQAFRDCEGVSVGV